MCHHPCHDCQHARCIKFGHLADALWLEFVVTRTCNGQILEGGAKEKPPQARVVSMEAFGKKLAHQFPWDPAAMVSIGLAMRRRFLSDPLAPSTRSRRQQIMRVTIFPLFLPLCTGGTAHMCSLT